MGLALLDVFTGENCNDTPDRVLPPGGRPYSMPLQFFTYTAVVRGRAASSQQRLFFNLSCFDHISTFERRIASGLSQRHSVLGFLGPGFDPPAVHNTSTVFSVHPASSKGR